MNRSDIDAVKEKYPVSPDVEKVNQANPASAVINDPAKLKKLQKAVGITTTHHARKCWSDLCQREFDSKAEMERGEVLFYRQKAGEIKRLEYHPVYILSEKPKVTITLDFRYFERSGDEWLSVDEDVKGWKLTKKTKKLVPRVERDFRVKLAWLKEKYGVSVKLVK